jgi:hypothetical protein
MQKETPGPVALAKRVKVKVTFFLYRPKQAFGDPEG